MLRIKTMSLQHLHAMGIQTWALQSKTQATYLLVSDDVMPDAADQLLNAMLESIDLKREQVLSSASIRKQITAIQPRLLLILGPIAAQHLLNCNSPIEDLRGKVHTFTNITTLVTHHPGHLLQNPKDKRQTYEDLRRAYHILKN